MYVCVSCSALAINPETGHVYIATSHGTMLVFDPKTAEVGGGMSVVIEDVNTVRVPSFFACISGVV